MANPQLPMYPDATGAPHILPPVANAVSPQSFSPPAPAAPAAPMYVPPATDPNMSMMLPNMRTPNVGGTVAPNNFGGVGGVPPAPVAAPAPAPAPVPPRVPGTVPGAPAFAPTNAMTPADRAYYAGANNSPSMFPPLSPADAAQAASDRKAILGAADNVGAVGADIVTAPARALTATANTLLRVPNALGLTVGYLPHQSGLMPYYDQVHTNDPADVPPDSMGISTKPIVSGPVSADRLARAGLQGDDGGQLPASMAARLAAGGQSAVNTSAAAAGGGYGMPGGLRDPSSAIAAGFDAQHATANEFMGRALDYINGGSNIFERATRGRAIAGILNAVMGPNNQGQVMGQGIDSLNAANAQMGAAGMYADASKFASNNSLAGEALRTAEQRFEYRNNPTELGTVPIVDPKVNPYAPRQAVYGFRGGGMTDGRPSTQPITENDLKPQVQPKEGATANNGKYVYHVGLGWVANEKN